MRWRSAPLYALFLLVASASIFVSKIHDGKQRIESSAYIADHRCRDDSLTMKPGDAVQVIVCYGPTIYNTPSRPVRSAAEREKGQEAALRNVYWKAPSQLPCIPNNTWCPKGWRQTMVYYKKGLVGKPIRGHGFSDSARVVRQISGTKDAIISIANAQRGSLAVGEVLQGRREWRGANQAKSSNTWRYFGQLLRWDRVFGDFYRRPSAQP